MRRIFGDGMLSHLPVSRDRGSDVSYLVSPATMVIVARLIVKLLCMYSFDRTRVFLLF